MTTHEILLAAQAAKLPLALADTDTKNAALEAMAVALVENSDAILAANKQDLAAARGRISDVMLDRLALTPARLAAMAKGMREVAALPDPIGTADRMWTRPNGLRILQKLDLDLKGSRLDAPLLMQKAICELSLARSRA